MYPRQYFACPIEALPDLLYSAAYDVRTLEDDVPAECLLTDAIAACAAAVHRCHDVRGLDARTMPSTVNTLALVPSGLGKGTSFSCFFQAFNAHATENHLQAIEAQDGQVQEKGKGKAREQDGLILQEVSYRALMECLHGINRNTTIQHEDGSSFLESDLVRKYIDKLTQTWSGNPPLKHKVYRTDLIAVGGRCSFGFRIQPKLYYPVLKKTSNASFHQGLWPRAIAACYDPERFQTPITYMPVPRSTGGMADLTARLEELLAQADERHAAGLTDRMIVVLGKEAATFMHELKFRMKQWRHTEYADIDEAAARAWENTLRVAAVFHIVCVGKGEISLEMVERAWIIVEWSLTQHRLIFVEANRPPPKPVLVRLMKAPKPPEHQQRLNADMQFMLDAICARAAYYQRERVLVGEVMLLSGFHQTRFLKTLGWLITGGYVEMEGNGEHASVRLTQPRFLGIAQGFSQSVYHGK
ncbi:DUF3987 domain-containing protein [Noviluteimonas gilva]|uniref:DUF3987 domain-containing protein n=1 Tax=Noviluteimonas gilva TaxID=2682097 RepID=A0A7C9HU40_9GAMM|nr:DUF3987 domain-containing protein [Lysobacter gilvus]MUV13358.1 DUF3987 domain-containing protein [Lysobacter gilvus]